MIRNENVLRALMPMKPMALSAVSINIDQKTLEGVLVGHNRDS